MKARSRSRLHLLIWLIVACITIKCAVGVPVPVPVPQDEGDEEEEVVEEAPSEGETVTTASESDDAAAMAAGAAVVTPTGGIPQGLSNILESSGPGETVARSDADEAAPAVAPEELGEEIVESSESAGAGEGAGAAGLLAGLQEGLKENAPHVAVGGIGVAAVACVVGFSSKIISMLKSQQLPDISTISDQLKKQMEGGKPDSANGSGPNDGSNANNANSGGPEAKAKDAMENAKEKLKSKLPWNKGAASASGGAATATGTGANANANAKAADAMGKKAIGENEAGPLGKGKQFLRKQEEIRKALKSKTGAGSAAKKLSGIAEDDEVEEDLIGVKNLESNLASAPGRDQSGSGDQAEQLAKIESLMENPEQLKELESLVQSSEDLERLREIVKKPLQIEEIRKLVDKPEQLRLLESLLEDPSNLRKLERSIEVSDKLEDIDSVLGKAKGMVGLGTLDQQRSGNLYSASPTLFGTESRSGGDTFDSGLGGGKDAAGGYEGKSEAIRRLDEILAKYNDDGHYAEGAGAGAGAGAGRRSDDYLYGSTSGGESPGDTLSRSMDYQRFGGDSRGSTMTRSAISPYDTAFYDNSNQIRMVGDLAGGESLQDIQRPAEFETLSDEDNGFSPLEDPRVIANAAKKQARAPSGVMGAGRSATAAKVAGGAVVGAGAMAAAKMVSPRTASPTVMGKVVPAQSAVAAARKLPQPTARTAASRAIGGYARPASPVTSGTGATASVVPSRLSRPTKTVSTQVISREREGDEYGSNDDLLRGRRVQFRPEYDDNYLYQQQTL